MLCFGLGAMLILMHVYGSSWCVQIQLTELILFGFNSFLNVPHASLFLTSLETLLLHTCQQSWLFITLCPNCLVLSVPILESSQEHTFLKCIQYLNEASSLNTQTPLRKIKSFSDQTTKTQSGWNPQMTSWLHTEHFVFTRKQKEEHFPVKKTHTKTKTNPLGRHPSIFYSSRTYSKKAQNKLWYDSYLFHLLHFDCRLLVSALTSDFFIHHHSRPH